MKNETSALTRSSDKALRKVILTVLLLNLAYFFIEFAVAQYIGSVSLFADSIDFLEDASINFLILIALGWSLKGRARVGQFLALVLFVPVSALLWTAWQKFHSPLAPEPWFLSITGMGALIINAFCALLLSKYRHHSGSLTRAAFLSARNDVMANIAIILAGVITLYWRSGWPDLIVGLAIACMNIDAAKEIWEAASKEKL
ncbi:MAG: cation transporter [Gammaproteobacteria bacterium]|nr:cation transporter [Gammaproteobacteria bacterium]